MVGVETFVCLEILILIVREENMARKTVGFVELEWVCPNCNMKNPGRKKICSGCGSPQPENIAFQRAQEEKIIGKEAIAPDAVRADIHCGFCGARNPADAKSCSQCSADLTAGKQRASGQILGAYKPSDPKEIKCPHCASMNPGNYQFCMNCGGSLAQSAPPQPAQQPPAAKKLSPFMLILLGLGMIIGCGLLVFLFSGLFKRDTITATVAQRTWQRSVAIEQYGMVEREGWLTEIPEGAGIGSCEKRVYESKNEPAPDSEEVCGTPYVVDKGSGLGEVVQDCEYLVKLDYCSYTINEWAVIDQVVLDGNDTLAVWPEPSLSQNQRLGEREAMYTIHFTGEGADHLYRTTDNGLYEKATVGSVWDLTVDGFDNVVSAEPR